MTPLTAKVFYKPVGLGLSLAAGALASLVTRRIWLWISDDDEMPDADDTDNCWPEPAWRRPCSPWRRPRPRACRRRGSAMPSRRTRPEETRSRRNHETRTDLRHRPHRRLRCRHESRAGEVRADEAQDARGQPAAGGHRDA